MTSYFEIVKPTYIENWSSDLCRLSIAQSGIKLSIDDAKRIGLNIVELFELFLKYKDSDSPPNCADIISKLDESISQFPNGAFVRLGSRSPKDSWYSHRNGSKSTNGKEAWKRLTDCSERVAEDLLLAIDNNYEPWIWVREWQKKIRKDNEFRIFMKNRQLIGISQYNYFDGDQDWIIKNAGSIKWAILQWFPMFRKASHLDTVICDVFVYERTQGNVAEWQIKLLEINPFSPLTDPCLFDWRNHDFDGKLRFLRDGMIYES